MPNNEAVLSSFHPVSEVEMLTKPPLAVSCASQLLLCNNAMQVRAVVGPCFTKSAKKGADLFNIPVSTPKLKEGGLCSLGCNRVRCSRNKTF